MKQDGIRTVSMFEGKEKLKITKPIRLIELFGGIGSQAKALERLGANFEHYRLCEFDKYAVTSYNFRRDAMMNQCDNCKRKPNCPKRCFPKMDYERGQRKRRRNRKHEHINAD